MRYFFLACVVLAIGACGDDEPSVGDAIQGETAPDGTSVDTAVGDAVEVETDDATQAETEGDAAEDTSPPHDTADVADTTAPQDTVTDTAPDTGDVSDTSDVSEIATGCDQADECRNCAYPKKVTSADDCYCVFCASHPMSKAECDDNQASWAQFCEPWPRPDICPAASCLPLSPPLCENSQCVANPNGCFFPDDCGSCRFTTPPITPEDCHCPTCSQPLAVDYCQAIEAAVSDICFDFDYDACPIPPCMRPPPIVCTESMTCGYGEPDPMDR